MAVPAKNIIESSRDIVQDFLVPELKAVKVSVESIEGELKVSVDSLERQIKASADSLRQEVKSSVENLTHQMDSLRVENKLRDEKLEQLVRSGLDRMELLIRTGDEKNAIATSFSQKNLMKDLPIATSLPPSKRACQSSRGIACLNFVVVA